jgi:aminoglycoside phosphotransferase (APT) family kinase protein
MARAVPGLDPLIAHLANAGEKVEPAWQGWLLQRIEGGGNNLLYRATSGDADLAIKFTISDSRDRAGREFTALSLLRQAGFAIAPEPVLLDRERYRMPVVVQTWLDGEVSADPPASDADWTRWLEHLATVHAITPEKTTAVLPETVLTMTSVADGLARIRQQRDCIPPSDQPRELLDILRRAEGAAQPTWAPPRLTLCHGDTNIRNMVRRPGGWAAVDWEYSGWGDPACEIATTIAHAAHLDAPEERWRWFVAAYAGLRDDPGVTTRIRVYTALMYAWWAARLARMLYDFARGFDQRLVPPPANWQADRQAKFERYLTVATQALAEA